MNKERNFLIFLLIVASGIACNSQNKQMTTKDIDTTESLKLFFGGDVMTGRGIDQAFPHSVEPVLYESYVKDARNYLQLAERTNGNIRTPVSYDYIWGDAMQEWEEQAPDLKLVNLETSITTHDVPWPGKGIHYRMHPQNVQTLVAAGIDYCSLANNHVLDWKRTGLQETMETLSENDIAFSGAGLGISKAAAPSILETRHGRVLVFSYGAPSSGIPPDWAARNDRSGVNYLASMDKKAVSKIKKEVTKFKQAGDVVVFSIHWGGNWGYEVPSRHQEFAHQLIDEAEVDLVFGHSSHHPMGIEVYRGKLVLYGAGDFINDYEGISGHEEYRGELSLMYFPKIDPRNGELISLKMVPMEIKKLQLHKAERKDARWLQKTLHRESQKLGTSVRKDSNDVLWMEW